MNHFQIYFSLSFFFFTTLHIVLHFQIRMARMFNQKGEKSNNSFFKKVVIVTLNQNYLWLFLQDASYKQNKMFSIAFFPKKSVAKHSKFHMNGDRLMCHQIYMITSVVQAALLSRCNSRCHLPSLKPCYLKDCLPLKTSDQIR